MAVNGTLKSPTYFEGTHQLVFVLSEKNENALPQSASHHYFAESVVDVVVNF